MEIALVLVIVGLLIGGVLKGREMITNAKIKRIETDHASTVVAAHSYQDRYGYFPGDDPEAEGRFDAYATGSGFNGDGNGHIGWGATVTLWDALPSDATENNAFWAHLRASGLVGGSATDRNLPANAYGGVIGVQARAFYTNPTTTYHRHALMFARVPGDVARILDQRLDDGARDDGDMRAREAQPLPSNQLPVILGNDPVYRRTYQDEQPYDIGLRM